jgi:hypothetical protein
VILPARGECPAPVGGMNCDGPSHQRVDKESHPIGHQVRPAERITDAMAAFLVLHKIDGASHLLQTRGELARVAKAHSVVCSGDRD